MSSTYMTQQVKPQLSKYFLDKVLIFPYIRHFSHFFFLFTTQFYLLESPAIIFFSNPPSYFYLNDPGRVSIISSLSTCFLHRSVYKNIDKNYHPANTFSVKSSNSICWSMFLDYSPSSQFPVQTGSF